LGRLLQLTDLVAEVGDLSPILCQSLGRVLVSHRKSPSYAVWPPSNLAADLPSATGRARLAPARFWRFLQHGGEPVELLLPVLAVTVDPDRHRKNPARAETASADAAGERRVH